MIINIYIKLGGKDTEKGDIKMYALRLSEAKKVIRSTGRETKWRDTSAPYNKDRCGYLIITKEKK